MTTVCCIVGAKVRFIFWTCKLFLYFFKKRCVFLCFLYDLAQTMNNLQIKLVSNKVGSSADKRSAISRQYWADLPDFQHQFLSFRQVVRNEWVSLVGLGGWFFGWGLCGCKGFLRDFFGFSAWHVVTHEALFIFLSFYLFL